MLAHEWRELETLCDRMSDLRHRYSFALRSRNVGLGEGLKEDIVRVKRQREDLVRHISARLGAASAMRRPPSDTAHRAPPHDAAPAGSARQAAGAGDVEDCESVAGI
jgi:hypothetical protein